MFYGPALGAMYTEFSQALSRYTHNLLARNTLNETLQNTLLHHLGVSPWSTETATPSFWPLQVYPRTLSVLAQVRLQILTSTTDCCINSLLPYILQILLLKPQLEKKSAEKNYRPEWKDLDSRPLPSWYDKAKFGIFIH